MKREERREKREQLKLKASKYKQKLCWRIRDRKALP